MRHFLRILAGLVIGVALNAAPIFAQQPEVLLSALPSDQAPPEKKEWGPFTDSLFLSTAEITSIKQAMLGTPENSTVLNAAQQVMPADARRLIKLAGVLFKDEGNWIIWLNGKKIQPGRLPSEIVDIRVESDRVHLKWFDNGSNKVISITLRPHQTYDIGAGILLPG